MAAVLASLLAVAIIVGAAVFGVLASGASEARVLRAENLQLRAQLGRLAELEQLVQNLDRSRRSLLGVAGIASADSAQALDGGAAEINGAHRTSYRRVEPDSLVSESELEEIREYIRRVPLAGPLTRRYGPVRLGGVFHTGVDVAGETGAPVQAAGEGVVSFVGSDEVFGLVLVISHTARLETMYGHNSQILVRVGDYVASGQRIASVGNTGVSSAPHLHFEIHRNGKAVDPARVLTGIGLRRATQDG